METNDYKRLINFVVINPKEKLKKNTVAKKVGMDKLHPYTKQLQGYSFERYKGGSKFRNGDTLFARITPCLENGKTAQVTILDKDEIGFGSTEFIVLRAKKNISNKDYIYYLSISKEFRNIAIKSMVGTSGRQRVQQSVLEQSKFFAPPLPTQKKIASILSALDDKIELNNKINKNLEEMAQAIFKSWFVDFEPWGGEMPDDWEYTSLSDIAEFINGYSYKGKELQKSTTAMATIKNFERNGGFKIEGFKEISPSAKLKPTQNVELFDLLVAHTDLTQKAEVLGNSEIVLSKNDYKNIIFSMDLVKVIPKTIEISKFMLAALLKNKYFKSYCLGYVNGTTVLHLSKNALKEYKLFLPINLSKLNPLNNIFENIYKIKSKNIIENEKLANLRDTLLPKLMSGELDVSNIEF